MSAVRKLWRRELDVAFSRNHQPIWFRILKWIMIVTTAFLLRRHPYFWRGVFGVLMLALGLHLFYRWKTHAWTCAWGGWNDVDPRA